MEEVLVTIRDLLKRAKTRGLTNENVIKYLKENGYTLNSRTDKKTDEVVQVQPTSSYKTACYLLNLIFFKLIPVLMVLSIIMCPILNMVTGATCLLTKLRLLGEVAMPVVNCDMCKNVLEAPRLSNLGREDFIRNYAYTGMPILVEGAASNWSAVEVFSYEYFKSLYLSLPESLDNKGQFFAYESNIMGLKELFTLPVEVASMQTEKWYIGWSCDNEKIGESLKQHVEVPYFIPPSLSDLSMSWIFMGSPGPGASLHIDDVELPSWQAQLRGKKTWILVPPPECQHVCHDFNVTMNTGDVIVVNTNLWFHQTYIHPGSISISIGSEYE